MLESTFRVAGGQLSVLDFTVFPEEAPSPGDLVLRRLEAKGTDLGVEVRFKASFDYALAPTRRVPDQWGVKALDGRTAVAISCGHSFELGEGDEWIARWRPREGEIAWLRIKAADGAATDPAPLSHAEGATALLRTLERWRRWSGTCTYQGPFESLVRRSALVLKLLTFEPSGGIVAAPTTSLSEKVGGPRNWDYRFVWLRDAALVLDALQTLGYHDESMSFWKWLTNLRFPADGPPQILYRVDGSPEAEEHELGHLEGYCGSRPVRVGNGARQQLQLDVFGHVLDAAWLCQQRMGYRHDHLSPVLRRFADEAARRWSEPDQGAWEVRTAAQHMLGSKLLCWVARDRALRLAERGG